MSPGRSPGLQSLIVPCPRKDETCQGVRVLRPVATDLEPFVCVNCSAKRLLVNIALLDGFVPTTEAHLPIQV